MIIHLIHTCDTFDYTYKLVVPDIKSDNKSKGNGVIISYNKKQITIPLSNIVAIEEQ